VVPLERLSLSAARQLEALGGQTSAAVFRAGWPVVYAQGMDKSLMLASVSKVLLSLQVLDEARRAGRSIDEWEAEALEWMIVYSDNWSTEWVWQQLGMSAGHQAWLDSRELGGLTAAWNDDWGDTAGNARDVGMVFARLLAAQLVPEADRELMVGLMADVISDQRWGVMSVLDHHFPTLITGGKNGWWPEWDGWWINSVGFVTQPDYSDWGLIVILTLEQDDFDVTVGAIEAIARDLMPWLTLDVSPGWRAGETQPWSSRRESAPGSGRTAVRSGRPTGRQVA
jgi:hypothetical protein